jgi:hypothetical protein
MDPLDRLDPHVRSALEEHLGRMKHDLAKYVAFQVRWLPEDAPLEARREALRSDLCATRRGPDGVQDAVALWAVFRPALVGEADLAGGERVDLSGDPDLQAIEGAMEVVGRTARALREGIAGEVEVGEGTAAALEVADRARELHRRTRGA